MKTGNTECRCCEKAHLNCYNNCPKSPSREEERYIPMVDENLDRIFADHRRVVASKIFWEVDQLLTAIYLDDEDGTNFVGVDIQKYHALKKKYMKIKTERKQ